MLNDDQRKFAEKHIKLAYHRANYWRFLDLDFDDILSACMYGFTKSVKYFDETKGLKFSTFSYRAIDNEVFRLIRYRKMKKRNATVLSLDIHEGEINEYQESFLDRMIGEEDQYTFENESLIKELMKKLEPKEKDIIQKYFFEKMKQKEIGEVYGLSQVQISRIVKKAIKKMRIDRESV